MNKQQEELLNAKLRAFEYSTGIQLFVYLTLNGPIKSKDVLAQQIFDTWGVGQKGKGNGALIAIFTSDQEFAIAGHGLNSLLPADIYREILDEEMTPFFNNENFYEGIDAGVDKLLYYSKHEYESPGLFDTFKEKVPVILGFAVLTLPFIIGFLIKMKRRKQP